MIFEEVKVKLKNQTHFLIIEEKETGSSRQIKRNSNSIIKLFQTNKHNVQGKNQMETIDLLGDINLNRDFNQQGYVIDSAGI